MGIPNFEILGLPLVRTGAALRREQWEELLAKVYEFCDKNDIFKLKCKMNILTPRSGDLNLKLQTNITIK